MEHAYTPDETVYCVTRADVDARAGRRVSDEEVARVATAVRFSSIPDALDEVVMAVCGYPPEDEEDGAAEGTSL